MPIIMAQYLLSSVLKTLMEDLFILAKPTRIFFAGLLTLFAPFCLAFDACNITREELRQIRLQIRAEDPVVDMTTRSFELDDERLKNYFPTIQAMAKKLSDNLFTGLTSDGSSTLVGMDDQYGLIVTASHTALADYSPRIMKMAKGDLGFPSPILFDEYLHHKVAREEILSKSGIRHQYIVYEKGARPQARTNITPEHPSFIIYKPFYQPAELKNNYYLRYEDIPMTADFAFGLVSLNELHEKNKMDPEWRPQLNAMKKDYPGLYAGLMDLKPIEPMPLDLAHFSSGLLFLVRYDQVAIAWGEMQNTGVIRLDAGLKNGTSGSGLFDCHGQFAGVVVRSSELNSMDEQGEPTAFSYALSLPMMAQNFRRDLEERHISLTDYFREFPLVRSFIEKIETKN